MTDISRLNSKQLFALNQKGNDSTEAKKNDAKVKEVADLYEKYFLKEMMKQMRSTVQEGGFLKANNAQKIFQEQLDDEYSTEWNKRGGFGISEMIYKQLTEKFGDELGLQNKMDKPHGPLPLDKKMNIKTLSQSTDKKSLSLLMSPQSLNESALGAFGDNTSENIEVKNPWAGVLQNKKIHEGNKASYEIKHDNGLESLIMTHGAPSAKTRHLSAGDKIESGQSLGLADSHSPLVWTVKKTVSE